MPEPTMHEEGKLDLLIDAALRTYGKADARLELRLLAQIADAGEAWPRRMWLGWAVALPVAACLVLLALWWAKPAPRMAADWTAKDSKVTAPVAGGGAAAPIPARAAVHRGGRSAAAGAREVKIAQAVPPKLDVFPTPRPLTAEEKTLALVTAQAPAPELRALAEAQAQADAPIDIAAIEITPLEPPAPSGN